MRVALVISSLSAGGAERVLSTMANYWAKKGWSITILTFDDGSAQPFYALDPAVRYRPLAIAGASGSVAQAIRQNLRRLLVLRFALRQLAPELVISFMTEANIRTLIAMAGLRPPVIVSERNNPFDYPAEPIWRALRRVTYPLAARIVVQSERSLSYF